MTDRELLLYNSLVNLHSIRRAPRMQVAHDLMGLQAQFSRNPEISLRLRAEDYATETWADGLVKTWTFRSTIHVVAEDELGLYLSAAAPGDFTDGAWYMTVDEQKNWSAFLRDQILEGNDTRDGLKRACTEAGMSDTLLSRAFYGWGGLIKEMANRGLLACGTGTDKRYVIPEKVTWMEQDSARRILVRRYFETFGPATTGDLRAFFQWRMTELRPVLEDVLPELAETKIEGTKYYHVRPLQTADALPECTLLPGFDQLVMGYRDRWRFLDPANARKLVNQAGIVFPAVIVRGLVRAKWKLDGTRVRVTPFERLLKKDEAAIRRTVRKQLGLRDVIFED